jgi:hypothetical protein
MVDLFSVRDLVNSQHLQAKIDCWQLQLQLLPHSVMQQVKAHNSIVAKEICESVLLPPNVYLVYVILFRSEQRSL